MQLIDNHLDSKERFFNSVAVVFIIALAWVALYYVNYSISVINVTAYVSWIFLPATLRLVSVLLFGWTGALGIFVGCLITILPLADTKSSLILIPMISAFSPLIAVRVCMHVLSLPKSLHSLSGNKLVLIALFTSLVTALFHSVYFYYTGNSVYFWSMFIGDFSGSLLLLYLVKIVLNWLSLPAKLSD